MKRILIIAGLVLMCGAMVQAQEERITGLYIHDTIAGLHRQMKVRKHVQGVFYTPVQLPFTDDFSHYTGYPDTALWVDNYAYVSTGFACNAPTIGSVLLDATDHRGQLYEQASVSTFGADTLTSRPIRLDSVWVPLKRAMELSDSLYFSFYYQPGGGKGKAWERIGNDPEPKDSLILEFGYQTGDTALLYYITDMQTIADTIIVGDTIISTCNSNIYIIAEQNYYPGDVVEVPCDSVLCMEVIWEKVWATPGMTLSEFETLYGTDFRQVMIPVNDEKYLNAGFQFRFRNIASLEYESDAAWACNVDFWNIDYVRLNRARTMADTVIDDVAFAENPGSLLQPYTAMPWSHFSANTAKYLKPSFTTRLTNLYNVTKNTTYEQWVTDEAGNTIGTYSGGAYNIDPYYRSGYQTYAPHASPAMATITFPAAVHDSVGVIMYHLFKEAGSGDKNAYNDTARYHQCFNNYFSYDDGTPESGYVVTSSVYPYTTSLAVAYTMEHADTLRAVRMYVNKPLADNSPYDFMIALWGDNNGEPGELLYEEAVEQEYSHDMYGMQHFELKEPQAVQGKIYVGYSTTSHNFLNIGFDQNTNASEQVFYRTSGGWQNSFVKGTPMIRAVTGARYAYSHLAEAAGPQPVCYPNPATDIIYYDNSADYSMVEIYAVNGQMLLRTAATGSTDVSMLPQGMYIIRLIGNKGVYTQKISVIQ